MSLVVLRTQLDPPVLATSLIRVENATTVSIWEKTGPVTELTYSVAALMRGALTSARPSHAGSPIYERAFHGP